MSSVQKKNDEVIGCIDLHNGEVKQIVGGTLTSKEEDVPKTNFVSQHPSSYYAKLYKDRDVQGCHVIKLGPNNDDAAREALQESPQFLQVGGGINDTNCLEWLKWASKVIVTSWLFTKEGHFQLKRLERLTELCGKDRIVVDLSCRKPRTVVGLELRKYTNEFLIHAADVEGLCGGIDELLVSKLFEWTKDYDDLKIVYAGGAKSVDDLKLVDELSHGKVDLTFGSSLDIFGGNLVKFEDCCRWNEKQG
ncbi:Histidine biosynthesis family protein [Saccharomyces cerevisiae]|nr:Histidine biosynthesis family protein [Saccharomyces cerevisiae]